MLQFLCVASCLYFLWHSFPSPPPASSPAPPPAPVHFSAAIAIYVPSLETDRNEMNAIAEMTANGRFEFDLLGNNVWLPLERDWFRHLPDQRHLPASEPTDCIPNSHAGDKWLMSPLPPPLPPSFQTALPDLCQLSIGQSARDHHPSIGRHFAEGGGFFGSTPRR